MDQLRAHALTNRVIGIRHTWSSILGEMEAAASSLRSLTALTPLQDEHLSVVEQSLLIMRESMEVVNDYTSQLSTFTPTNQESSQLLLDPDFGNPQLGPEQPNLFEAAA